MKKIVSLFITLIMSISLFVPAFADNEIKVFIDTKPVTFGDATPQIINDRTMVPMRAIFESLSANVDWNPETRTASATKGITRVEITIDKRIMRVNGEQKPLDTAPLILQDRTMVPVRAISEAFGCQVGWDGIQRYVSVVQDTENFAMLYNENGRSIACALNNVDSMKADGWKTEPILNLKPVTEDEIQKFKDENSLATEEMALAAQTIEKYVNDPERDKTLISTFGQHVKSSKGHFNTCYELSAEYEKLNECSFDLKSIINLITELQSGKHTILAVIDSLEVALLHMQNIESAMTGWIK